MGALILKKRYLKRETPNRGRAGEALNNRMKTFGRMGYIMADEQETLLGLNLIPQQHHLETIASVYLSVNLV